MTCSVIIDNLKKIRLRLSAAAQRSGRSPDAVSLIAVTKYAPISAVRELLEAGLVTDVGENRVSDAAAKIGELGTLARGVRWRLIGHLQTNKARKAAEV